MSGKAKPAPVSPEGRIALSYRQFGSHLLRFLAARLDDGAFDEAEDYLQDVFLDAIAAGVDGDDRDPPSDDPITDPSAIEDSIEDLSAWLFAVARRKLIDRWRRKSRRSHLSPGGQDPELALASIPGDTDVEAEFLGADLRRQLDQAIAELPAKQRRAIVEQAIEGRSFRALSRESGEPVNTWIARKRYALEYLRRRLKDLE